MLPSTIHDPAAGSQGIAIACDLADDDRIVALFQRVQRDSGRLDILVNNVAFMHNDMTGERPFWEEYLALADIFDIGLRCHYAASHQAAPLMVRRGFGLIVNTCSSVFVDGGLTASMMK